MVWRILASAVFVLHVMVIIYLIASSVVNILIMAPSAYPTYFLYHLMFLALVGISQIIFQGCPLTILETSLRCRYDPNYVPSGSVVARIVQNITGLEIPVAVITLATLLIIVSGVIVLVVTHWQ